MQKKRTWEITEFTPLNPILLSLTHRTAARLTSPPTFYPSIHSLVGLFLVLHMAECSTGSTHSDDHGTFTWTSINNSGNNNDTRRDRKRKTPYSTFLSTGIIQDHDHHHHQRGVGLLSTVEVVVYLPLLLAALQLEEFPEPKSCGIDNQRTQKYFTKFRNCCVLLCCCPQWIGMITMVVRFSINTL